MTTQRAVEALAEALSVAQALRPEPTVERRGVGTGTETVVWGPPTLVTGWTNESFARSLLDALPEWARTALTGPSDAAPLGIQVGPDPFGERLSVVQTPPVDDRDAALVALREAASALWNFVENEWETLDAGDGWSKFDVDNYNQHERLSERLGAVLADTEGAATEARRAIEAEVLERLREPIANAIHQAIVDGAGYLEPSYPDTVAARLLAEHAEGGDGS